MNATLVDRLDRLETQFDAIEAPEQVRAELTRGEEDDPGLQALRDAGFLTVVPVDRPELYVEIARELDEGETAAITYAIENAAELVLLDERDGRRVARRHDLDVTGVIGILLRGVRDDEVELETELDALRDAGFWISDDLYAECHVVNTTRNIRVSRLLSAMSREREDSGRYTEAVTPDDVLGVFTDVEGPVVTSGDVAEALSCSRETARRKLRELEAEGRVASRKTAGRVVWWLTDSNQVTTEIDPDDPLFTGAPLLAPDEPVDETEIDSVVYGDADG